MQVAEPGRGVVTIGGGAEDPSASNERLPRDYPRLRRVLRRLLLRVGNVRRIHIIGCSRSGTSMFQLSLQAFHNVRMCARETNAVHFPSLREAQEMALRRTREPRFYVTKRQSQWHRPAVLDALRRECLREQVALIHLVRDPRDVMTSRHRGSADSEGYYVDERLWERSIRAADELFAAVEGRVPALHLRYEDVVLAPDESIRKLSSTFGLRLRDDVTSWAALTTYVRQTSRELVDAMHGIRDIDARSLGRWRKDPSAVRHVEFLLERSSIAPQLRAFLTRFRYENSGP